MVDLNEVRPSLNVPERACDALSGSDFAASIMNLVGEARDEAIVEQLLQGNVPQFMRVLSPVNWSTNSKIVTYFVTPDYLCVGSDDDYLRVSLNPLSATRVAQAFRAFLPTRRMVNAIFAAADIKLVAKPLGGSPKMRTTAFMAESNRKIQEQLSLLSWPLGSLVAGHKKDIVLCKGLWFDKDGKAWGAGHIPCVAIYGWAQAISNGVWTVWQGLNSSSHDNKYEDYSHGTRLVAEAVYINDDPYIFDQVLCDPAYAACLSDEGALPAAQYPNT